MVIQVSLLQTGGDGGIHTNTHTCMKTYMYTQTHKNWLYVLKFNILLFGSYQSSTQ